MYSFNATYNKEVNNSFKFVISDNSNLSKVIRINLYEIRGSWYIDVLEENNVFLYTGRRITSYVDIFKILKNRHKDFPIVDLKALPINTSGFEKEFVGDTVGILQDLLVVV